MPGRAIAAVFSSSVYPPGVLSVRDLVSVERRVFGSSSSHNEKAFPFGTLMQLPNSGKDETEVCQLMSLEKLYDTLMW